MPISATLTFDLDATQPSLTVQIADAVLEGDDPFPLTVRSSSGVQLADGSYRFMGDYLQELNPSGTQYGFDWNFSTSTNGRVLWNGIIGWMGGHIWYVSVSDLTLVPLPKLSIERLGTASVQIMWATNFTDHVLESAGSLSAAGWSTVTNSVAITGQNFSITVATAEALRFYRLRKP